MATPKVGNWECLRRAYNETFLLTPDKPNHIQTPLTDANRQKLQEWFSVQDRFSSQHEINETFDDPTDDEEDDDEDDEDTSHQNSERGSNKWPLPPPFRQIAQYAEDDPLPWIEEYNGGLGSESDSDSTARNYPPC